MSADRIAQMRTRAPDSRHMDAGSWCPIHDGPRARFECKECFDELGGHAADVSRLREALRWALSRLRSATERHRLLFNIVDYAELAQREQVLAETHPLGP